MPLGSRPLDMLKSHYVLCTFVGLLVLDLYREPIRKLNQAEGGPQALDVLLGCLIAGGITAGITWCLHRFLLRNLRRKYYGEDPVEAEWRRCRFATIIGFFCGVQGPIFAFGYVPKLLMGAVFLVLSIGYVRHFFRSSVRMLRPGSFPHPRDVAELVFVYAAVLACFTVLNVSLIIVHRLLGRADPFTGFTSDTGVLDALYFSVVVMTTLGFGDISPVTADARLLIIFEVIAGYVLFAMLIGTITRGVLPMDEGEKD